MAEALLLDLVRPAFLRADDGESDDGANDDKSDEGHTNVESSPPTRAEISRFFYRADGVDWSSESEPRLWAVKGVIGGLGTLFKHLAFRVRGQWEEGSNHPGYNTPQG